MLSAYFYSIILHDWILCCFLSWTHSLIWTQVLSSKLWFTCFSLIRMPSPVSPPIKISNTLQESAPKLNLMSHMVYLSLTHSLLWTSLEFCVSFECYNILLCSLLLVYVYVSLVVLKSLFKWRTDFIYLLVLLIDSCRILHGRPSACHYVMTRCSTHNFLNDWLNK